MPSIQYYSNAWGASRALLTIKAKKKGTPLLILAPDQKQADLLQNELLFFSGTACPVFPYPEYAQEPFEEVRVSPEISAKRALALQTVLTYDDYILITTPYALIKKIAPVDAFKAALVTLSRGEIFPLPQMHEMLDRLGYSPVEVVTGPGEYRARGGIVDIFPVQSENPVRIEYFDDELDSLFSYDIQTQKTIAEIRSTELLPVSEILLTAEEMLARDLPLSIREKVENFGKYAGHQWLTPLMYDSPSSLIDYLGDRCDLIILHDDWQELFDRVYVSVSGRSDATDLSHPLEGFVPQAFIKQYLTSRASGVFTDIASGEHAVSAGYRGVKSLFAFEKKNIYHSLSGTLKVMKQLHDDGFSTAVAMESARFIDLLKDFCRDHEIAVAEISRYGEVKKASRTLYLYNQRISGGFLDEKNKFVFITDEEIFGFVRKKNRPKAHEAFSTTIADLSEGDYVVHINYGIGIYRGLKHMVLGGLEGDYLEIGYENNELLFVPLEQITQIQKYIGAADAKPRLASLQSTNWSKLKVSARRHAAKIAQDLLKLYAERKARKRPPFADNGELLAEFEERFEYDETEDQLSAILDVYKDMESHTPMERLICGDVGFGKTEVAMRAAFKAVIAGKQAAVLVPTTVLARQHYITFSNRFRDFPVRVDYLSRFRTPEDIRKIKKKLIEGENDILISTHRMLSQDILFKDLRLLVIDEEQRFGVAHKEKIAAMRANVDVLSLSATPIPRTLQLSLSGIRDMSVIETPPENRHPVAVKVIQHEDDVRRAIQKELERGGQVFFLHNRIKDIDETASLIKRMAPEASVAVAHGQTLTKELDTILKDFYDGRIHILVSTSIIENGIDIPNVNTILIDNAQNFGLAQLYQLKGRVGRSSRRSYCYLIVNDFSAISPIAKKRLTIVQQLSDLGSGLKIAMYDLELRGAGDILGAEQSGFVTKVGYELFIKMIAEAVAELQQVRDTSVATEIVTQFPHYISADYIEDPKIRLDYYREFAAIPDKEEMEALFDELSSQYGPLKEETLNLGYIMLVKNMASRLGIVKAGIYPKMIRLQFAPSGTLSPTTLMAHASALKLAHRFSGEYEFVLAIEKAEETLLKGIIFLEMLENSQSSSTMTIS